MFKVIIEGKTPEQLKENIRLFLGPDKEVGVKELPSQFEKDYGAAPQPITTMVGADPNQHLTEQPARSIPSPSFPAPLIAPSVAPIAPALSSVSTVEKNAVPTDTAVNEFGVDSKGLSWDERIHSVTQAKNKDGSWRYRRGIEDSYISQVEAELATKARLEQSQGMVTPPIPQPHSFAPPPPAPVPLAVVPPHAPTGGTLMGNFTPPPLPPIISVHTLETFRQHLIPTLGKLVNEGKLTTEFLASLKAYFKVEEIWQVNDQQLSEMFEQFVAGGLVVRA